MPEDDPTFISDEENEAIFREKEKTPGIGDREAIRRVIGNARAARLAAAERAAKPEETVGKPTSRPSYRARFQDSTDDSVRAARQALEGEEVSDEEFAAGLEHRDFSRLIAASGTTNILDFLAANPEKTEDARRLGFLDGE